MKKHTTIFLDPDLIEVEKEPREVDCTIVLTPEQAIELAVCSCIKVNGRFYYKKRRFDSVLQVNGSLKPGELIAETNSAFFVLSPNQKESLTAPKPIMVPEPDFDKVGGKYHYFDEILSR